MPVKLYGVFNHLVPRSPRKAHAALSFLNLQIKNNGKDVTSVWHSFYTERAEHNEGQDSHRVCIKAAGIFS